ncbi:MAG TPA: cation:proton antiporter [Bacteroidales bacterium]|nr:cation:proton antiporter [Bacteroidales bacterium]
MEYIAISTGFALMLLGLWGILSQKNLIKIVLGFTIFDTGINIVMVSIGYVKGKAAPILDVINASEAANKIVDPVPQALVLTAIVIGLGVTALMLVYVLKLHREKNSLDINSFKDLKW